MGKRYKAHWRCPKCLRVAKKTKHHLHPKRYWKGRGPVADVCRECHDNLESFIADVEAEKFAISGKRKLTQKEYEDLFYLWLSKN